MVPSLNRWVGKLAVVTGSSAGIGAEIVKKLLNAGIMVVGLDLTGNKSNVEKNFYAIQCNVCNDQQVNSAFEKIKAIGLVHIVINNAGLAKFGTLCDGNPADWKTVLETNVLGPCIVTKAALKVMLEHKIAGQIININSTLGHHIVDIPQANIYPASKFAITAITETLRLELIGRDSNVKITSISPGPVGETEFFSKSNMDAGISVKNYLKPEDIADGVIYVLSTPPHVQVAELTLRPVNEKF